GLVPELGEVHVRDGANLGRRQRGDSDVRAELAAGDEKVRDVADKALAEDADAERSGEVRDDDDPVDRREVHVTPCGGRATRTLELACAPWSRARPFPPRIPPAALLVGALQ